MTQGFQGKDTQHRNNLSPTRTGPSTVTRFPLREEKRFKLHYSEEQHSDLAWEEFSDVQGLMCTHGECLQFNSNHFIDASQDFMDMYQFQGYVSVGGTWQAGKGTHLIKYARGIRKQNESQYNCRKGDPGSVPPKDKEKTNDLN